LNSNISNSDLEISIGTSDTDFIKVLATSLQDGSLNVNFSVTNKSTGATLQASTGALIIDKLPSYQTIDELKSSISLSLKGYTPTNDTTKEDLIGFLNPSITNSSLSLSIADEDFKKTLATSTHDGIVNTDISLSDSVSGTSSKFNSGDLTIAKLPTYQTIDELKTKLKLSLEGYSPTNSTVKEDLLRYLSLDVTNSDLSLTIDDSDFTKVLATSSSDGYVSAKIGISNISGVSDTLDSGNLIISKILEYQTSDEAEAVILGNLNNFKATNSTTKQDIITVASNGVSDKYVVDIKDSNFNKVLATASKDGSISATLDLINKSDSVVLLSKDTDLVIEKNPLYQSKEELVEAVKNALDSFTPANNTTKNEILQIIRPAILNGKPADFGSGNDDFKLISSSTSSVGTIKGTIIIGDVSIPIELEIPKLSSSGNSGGGSSDSTINNDTSTTKPQINGSASFSLLGIERGGIPSTVNTLQDNEQVTESVIDGVDSNVYAVAIPYKEDNAELNNTDVNGNLKLLYKDTSCVGVVLESDSEYTDSTVVSIASNMKAEDLKAYSYNKDINLYTESNPDLQSDGEVLKLRGTGKNNTSCSR
jgi:hypothetical protein